MKRIITSNSRASRSALCALLCITTLWAMPRSARAQLYVSQGVNNTVGEYNATTGAPINANLITGLRFPTGLAVAAVPEASPWSMIAVGGVALLGIMHRKKHLQANVARTAGVAEMKF